MTETIGVGVIGVNSDRGWAATAHIPALRALPRFKIEALSTTRRESARQAADKFDVELAFDNHEELVNHPAVDLVVITVKVPMHKELALAALHARKHVYCEWPLGNGLSEAEELAAYAKKQGVRAFVGLQARFSPTMQYVRQLVADGYVGRVLSVTLVGSGMAWSGVATPADAYVNDQRNGATLLTIPLAHALDAICHALGEVQSVDAAIATHTLEATLQGTLTRIAKSSEDQVVVAGTLNSGATLSVHYRSGRCRGTNMSLEINGTEGDLLLSGSSGHLQLVEPLLQGGRGADSSLGHLPIPAQYLANTDGLPRGPAFNVARAYMQLADDLRNATDQVATFEHAVVRHRMIEAVRTAAHTGQRQLLRNR